MIVAAVEQGSLSAAARRYGRSPAAATRALAVLERHTGCVLLLRSTRKLSLTPAGQHHVEVWRDVLARLDDGEIDATEANLQGQIVITAPELFGRLQVMPLVEEFLDTHPGVSARVLLVNRVVNLTGEGVDLAVRLAPLPDSTLKAIKVGDITTMFCASPSYLEKNGAPATPQDLADHECIGLNAEGDHDMWPIDAAQGRRSSARSSQVYTRLSTNSAAGALDAALRGRGIMCARSYQVAGHIAAGRLVPLLTDLDASPTPVHLVFPSSRSQKGVVRTFINYLVPVLRQQLRFGV